MGHNLLPLCPFPPDGQGDVTTVAIYVYPFGVGEDFMYRSYIHRVAGGLVHDNRSGNFCGIDSKLFSDKITCPVLTTVGFKDNYSPPKCVFSLFNHLLCEKLIEVYPDEGNEAGGKKQLKKSLQWLVNNIYT